MVGHKSRLPFDLANNHKSRSLFSLAGRLATAEGKKMFFKIFYSKSNSKSKLKHLLVKEFPNVFKILDLYKSKAHLFPWYNKEKPHASLAVLLQFIESYLIIDVICQQISHLYPDLPIFTIHDNILTVKGDEDKVRRVMEVAIKDMMWIAPIINVE